MYKLLLTLLLLSTSSISLGQKFSLQELINMNNMDWNDFDTYVTSKGYTFFKTEDDDFAETKSYANGQDSEKAAYFIAKSIYKKYTGKMIAFQTSKSKEYLAFKEQLKKLGFKYVDTETSNTGTVFLNYSKGNLTLSLASFQAENNFGSMNTSYEISITKK